MSLRGTAARLAGAALATKLAVAGGAVLASFLALVVVLLAWMAVVAGAGASPGCSPTLSDGPVPAHLRPIFSEAAERYRLGARGPAILAALTKIESGYGQNMGPSSAGAIGWTQFLPSTWRHFGVDGDGDGSRDPYDPDDAIHSAANYLSASGAPTDWPRALFAYNHSRAYVSEVLGLSDVLSSEAPAEASCLAAGLLDPSGTDRVEGGGDIIPIAGMPGEYIDARIAGDVAYLASEFHVTVTDGYAPTGHKRHGEHPLGLAVDLVPGPGGTWDDVDRLARWAEPRPNQPRAPFRWVGYDGDPDHGRGNHLHLSWSHGPAPGGRPPAAWVVTLRLGDRERPRRRRS